MIVKALSLGMFLAAVALVYLVARLFIKPASQDRPAGDKQPDRESLDQQLRRAGYFQRARRKQFVAVRNSLVVLALLGTVAVSLLLDVSDAANYWRNIALGLAIAAVCWSGPALWIGHRAKRRTQRICHGLPDAIELICMCLKGGMSLSIALRYVCAELKASHPDLAAELNLVAYQSEMSSLETAFRQFAQRMDVDAVSNLAALIEQGTRLGGDVSHALHELAETMRNNRRQLAEERANRASVTLIFPVTLCIVPSVLIIGWGPALLQLATFLHNFDVDANLDQLSNMPAISRNQ